MIAGLPLLAWPGNRGDGQVLAILIYHRVLARPDPLRFGDPDRDQFERQMRFLARHFAVLPLTEAVRGLQRGKLPKRACCITFDDGYADNLTVALPILERFGLPATVFVATGYLDGGRMFNDAAIDLVAGASGPDLDLRSIGLDVLPIHDIAARRAAIEVLLSRLKYLVPTERDALLARVMDIAGGHSLPTDLMLTTSQLRALAERGVEIGGHTVAHTILSTLDDASARSEILRGKRQLEEITGKAVKVFAYPNGGPRKDYTSAHVAMMRELGFDVAVTTAYGVGNMRSDPYQLPRFTPWGSSMAKWSVQLVRNALLKRPASAC